MEKKDYSKQGKKNKVSGRVFEAKVREDLEKMGWIVDKWMNTVDYEKNKIVPAKRKYNPYLRAFSIGTGFPDFICFKKNNKGFEVIGIEVKTNGYLDKIERGMCIWLLESKVFSKILIAKKKKISNRIHIEYIDFAKKHNKP